MEPDGLLYLSSEDERLAGMAAHDLDLVVAESCRLIPTGGTLGVPCSFSTRSRSSPVRKSSPAACSTASRSTCSSGSSAKLLSHEVATDSERRRMVNPRKAYPIDPGLIPIFDRSGRSNLGRALETSVLLELDHLGADVSYLHSPAGLQ